ncbi:MULTISPECIES: hypothetical protein [Thermus]|jgi:predicted RNase H-like nuclease (RuvC/YqgF family)|uniref:Chromosome partition protein Smc n=1 Tax=Thermus brockianus TaxID=56956 RepID=A0A1J0LQC0_THEBO|nr:hypothetical protein [Thermus brockianus]APD08472.1 hypothetical protein A0O31_00250 [Thermus brockianus]BDG16178.1 hypothetical protein TbrSNM41_09120 [Thermus brockianus]
MFHWDDDLERRMRAELARREMWEKPLREEIGRLQLEVWRLKQLVQHLQGDKEALRWKVREVLLERAFPEEELLWAKRVLEEAWLELSLMGSERASEVSQLIHHLERIWNARNPRRSISEPPPPEP